MLAVKTPCTADWNTMTGSESVRHCGGCRKDVYNLSAMTEAQAEALLDSAEDHCIRYYYRPDGTLVSSRCAEAPRKSPAPLAAGMAMSLAVSAGFAGITVAVGDLPASEAASADEPGVLVAMGLGSFGLKPRAKRRRDVVSDVPTSLAPANLPPVCAVPWDGCDTPAPATAASPASAAIAATTSPGTDWARVVLISFVLAGLLGTLVWLPSLLW
jgi:hypothetical protein